MQKATYWLPRLLGPLAALGLAGAMVVPRPIDAENYQGGHCEDSCDTAGPHSCDPSGTNLVCSPLATCECISFGTGVCITSVGAGCPTNCPVPSQYDDSCDCNIDSMCQ